MSPRMAIVAGPPGSGKSTASPVSAFGTDFFNAGDRAAALNNGSYRGIPRTIRGQVNRLFEAFDYSDGNPMHKSSAQVKDGVLCRDTEDPQRFFLIAEWADIEEHARIRKILANEIKPEFIKYIEGHKFVPKYVEVVSSTPDEILKKAAE